MLRFVTLDWYDKITQLSTVEQKFFYKNNGIYVIDDTNKITNGVEQGLAVEVKGRIYCMLKQPNYYV